MVTADANMTGTMTPSARKSLGEYKPMIRHGNGRTEIVGKRGYNQHWVALTNGGEAWHWRRGLTFVERSDAIAYAQKHIEDLEKAVARRKAEREARHARYAQQRHGD